MNLRPPLCLAAAALALAACQTIDDSQWVGGEGTPFNQAERSCVTQTERIAAKEDRPKFFVGCMAALGWLPEPGSPYADPASAPDPT